MTYDELEDISEPVAHTQKNNLLFSYRPYTLSCLTIILTMVGILWLCQVSSMQLLKDQKLFEIKIIIDHNSSQRKNRKKKARQI